MRIFVHMSWSLNRTGFWGRHSNQKLSHCYGLNVCVLAKSVCWNLISSVMVLGRGAFGKFLDCKGEGLLNGIRFLIIKGTPEISFAYSSIWQNSRKIVVYEPGSGSPPDIQSTGTLLLDSLTFGIARNKCLLLRPLVCGIFVIAAQMD